MARFVVVCACLVIPASAQNTPNKLPDDFARSAFKVAKLIEGEIGVYGMTASGVATLPSDPVNAINSVDADAETMDEQAVVVELKQALKGRLTHNTQLSGAADIARGYLRINEKPYGAVDVAALLSRVPQVTEIHQKETVCFADLETKLRSRDTKPVTSCLPDVMKVADIEIEDLRRVGQP